MTQPTDITRLSGSLGTNWRLWKDPTSDLKALSAYLDFGNTFQPPQIDFGPEPAAGPLLHPETERSIEFGLKNDSLESRLDVDLSSFVVDFNNQAIAAEVNGFATLAAGGRERFKGVEIEGHYRPSERLTVRANYSYNDARYRDFTTVIDGSLVQLAGNRLALSPQDLAALGVIHGGTQGFQGALTLNYVGRRYLDMQNTVPAKAFMTASGSFGYRFRDWTVSMNIYNLGNRRDPVLTSEWGEDQIYRLTGRRAFMTVSATLR